MKKILHAALSSIVISLGISVAFGDSTPPIAVCKSYLHYSDSGFDSWVSSSRMLANTVANQLNSCLKANVCSTITDVQHCAATLASRAFTSNFYANYSSKISNLPNFFSGSSGGLGKSRSTLPRSSMATKNTAPAASSQTTQTPAVNTNKTTGSSINWY